MRRPKRSTSGDALVYYFDGAGDPVRFDASLGVGRGVVLVDGRKFRPDRVLDIEVHGEDRPEIVVRCRKRTVRLDAGAHAIEDVRAAVADVVDAARRTALFEDTELAELEWKGEGLDVMVRARPRESRLLAAYVAAGVAALSAVVSLMLPTGVLAALGLLAALGVGTVLWAWWGGARARASTMIRLRPTQLVIERAVKVHRIELTELADVELRGVRDLRMVFVERSGQEHEVAIGAHPPASAREIAAAVQQAVDRARGFQEDLERTAAERQRVQAVLDQSER